MQEIRYRGKLKEAIANAGLSQRQFARRIGVNESIVSRVITGRWSVKPIEKIVWAAHLGREPQEVFEDN